MLFGCHRGCGVRERFSLCRGWEAEKEKGGRKEGRKEAAVVDGRGGVGWSWGWGWVELERVVARMGR